MILLERGSVDIAHIGKKNDLKLALSGLGRRLVKSLVISPIARGRVTPRKTISKTITKSLDVNGLPIDIIYDKTLSHCLMYVVYLTKWEKA